MYQIWNTKSLVKQVLLNQLALLVCIATAYLMESNYLGLEIIKYVGLHHQERWSSDDCWVMKMHI